MSTASSRLILVLLCAGATSLVAQEKAPPLLLSDAIRGQVVESLAQNLEKRYVFPDVGNRMAADLRARFKRGEFNDLASGGSFAEALTDRMREIGHDKHLNVRYSPRPEPPSGRVAQPPDDREFLRRINYGFERVERLRGNVGYLKLRGFIDPAAGRATALAALRFLGNADALIIDLRQNGGGEPGMVALISSILFPKGKKVHLNDLHWRAGNKVEQYYTEPNLDLPRISGEVYVLTSENTFSAAEEFTYNLKQLKRATQVGETTGGGANPGDGVWLHPNFGVFMPTGHAVNPITKDNWEGKGCVPEIPVKASEALKTAHIKALEGLIAKEQDPEARAGLTGALDDIRSAPAES